MPTYARTVTGRKVSAHRSWCLWGTWWLGVSPTRLWGSRSPGGVRSRREGAGAPSAAAWSGAAPWGPRWFPSGDTTWRTGAVGEQEWISLQEWRTVTKPRPRSSPRRMPCRRISAQNAWDAEQGSHRPLEKDAGPSMGLATIWTWDRWRSAEEGGDICRELGRGGGSRRQPRIHGGGGLRDASSGDGVDGAVGGEGGSLLGRSRGQR